MCVSDIAILPQKSVFWEPCKDTFSTDLRGLIFIKFDYTKIHLITTLLEEKRVNSALIRTIIAGYGPSSPGQNETQDLIVG